MASWGELSSCHDTGRSMKVSNDYADDDAPLLNLRANARVSSSDGSVSVSEAHRRRARALLQALWNSPVVCVCTAAVVFAFAAFLVKLMGNIVPVFEIVLFRSVTSFLICVVSARASGITPFFGRRAHFRMLMARGLFGAGAMTTYYFSIRYLPLADAVTLFFLNPAITAIAAWVIMHEPLGPRGVAGILVSLGGLLLVTRPPFLFGEAGNATDGGGSGDVVHAAAGSDSGLHTDAAVGAAVDETQRLLGSMFGLLSAVLSAGAFICIRHIGKSEPALVMSVYFHSCAAITSVVPLAVGVPRRAVAPTGTQWLLLLAVGNCSFWGQILISRGFQLLNAAKASAINLTQVVYSYLLGLLFLHESFTLLGTAGSVLIGLGALLVNLKPKKETNSRAPAHSPPTANETAETTSETATGRKTATTEVEVATVMEKQGTAGRPEGDKATATIASEAIATTSDRHHRAAGSTAEPATLSVVVEMAGSVHRSIGANAGQDDGSAPAHVHELPSVYIGHGATLIHAVSERHQERQRLLCPAKLSDQEQTVMGHRGGEGVWGTGDVEFGVRPGLGLLARQGVGLMDEAPGSAEGWWGVGCQGLSACKANPRHQSSYGAGGSGNGGTGASSTPTIEGRTGSGEEGSKTNVPPLTLFAASRDAAKEGGSSGGDSCTETLDSVALIPAGNGTCGIRSSGTGGGWRTGPGSGSEGATREP